MENTKIIQDLRDEISRLREKLATTGRAGGANKDDVLQMEVSHGLFGTIYTYEPSLGIVWRCLN